MSRFSCLSIFHPFKLHKSISTKQGQGCKKEKFHARKRDIWWWVDTSFFVVVVVFVFIIVTQIHKLHLGCTAKSKLRFNGFMGRLYTVLADPWDDQCFFKMLQCHPKSSIKFHYSSPPLHKKGGHQLLTLYFPIRPEQVLHILLRHMCSGQIADKNPSLQVTRIIAVGAVRWRGSTSASSMRHGAIRFGS